MSCMSKICSAVVLAAMTSTVETHGRMDSLFQKKAGSEMKPGDVIETKKPNQDEIFGKTSGLDDADRFGEKMVGFEKKPGDSFETKKSNWDEKFGKKAGIDERGDIFQKNFTKPFPDDFRKNFTKPFPFEKPDFNETEWLHNRSIACNATKDMVTNVNASATSLRATLNATNVTLSEMKGAVHDFVGDLKGLTEFNFTKWEEFLEARKTAHEERMQKKFEMWQNKTLTHRSDIMEKLNFTTADEFQTWFDAKKDSWRSDEMKIRKHKKSDGKKKSFGKDDKDEKWGEGKKKSFGKDDKDEKWGEGKKKSFGKDDKDEKWGEGKKDRGDHADVAVSKSYTEKAEQPHGEHEKEHKYKKLPFHDDDDDEIVRAGPVWEEDELGFVDSYEKDDDLDFPVDEDFLFSDEELLEKKGDQLHEKKGVDGEKDRRKRATLEKLFAMMRRDEDTWARLEVEWAKFNGVFDKDEFDEDLFPLDDKKDIVTEKKRFGGKTKKTASYSTKESRFAQKDGAAFGGMMKKGDKKLMTGEKKSGGDWGQKAGDKKMRPDVGDEKWPTKSQQEKAPWTGEKKNPSWADEKDMKQGKKGGKKGEELKKGEKSLDENKKPIHGENEKKNPNWDTKKKPEMDADEKIQRDGERKPPKEGDAKWPSYGDKRKHVEHDDDDGEDHEGNAPRMVDDFTDEDALLFSSGRKQHDPEAWEKHGDAEKSDKNKGPKFGGKLGHGGMKGSKFGDKKWPIMRPFKQHRFQIPQVVRLALSLDKVMLDKKNITAPVFRKAVGWRLKAFFLTMQKLVKHLCASGIKKNLPCVLVASERTTGVEEEPCPSSQFFNKQNKLGGDKIKKSDTLSGKSKGGKNKDKSSPNKPWSRRGNWKKPVGTKPSKPQTPPPGSMLVEATVETEMRLPTGVTETTLQSDTGFITVSEASLAESLGEPVENVGVAWVSVSSSNNPGRTQRLLQRANKDVDGKATVKVETGYEIRADSSEKVASIGAKMKDADTMRRYKASARAKLGEAEFDHEELSTAELGEAEPRARDVSMFMGEVTPTQERLGDEDQVVVDKESATRGGAATSATRSSTDGAVVEANSAAAKNTLLAVIGVVGLMLLF